MSQFPNRAALWLNKLAPDAPLMSGLCLAVRDLWPETHFRAPVALWQPSVCRQSGSYWSFCPPGSRPRRGV